MLVFMLSALSGCSAPKKETGRTDGKDSIRFYDFDFEIRLHHSEAGLCEEFRFRGDTEELADKRKIVRIRFCTDEMEKLPTPDTSDIFVSKDELDLVYQKIASVLTPKHVSNETGNTIPPPPIPDNEWVYCEVTLNLKYRGDVHRVRTSKYKDLIKLLHQ